MLTSLIWIQFCHPMVTPHRRSYPWHNYKMKHFCKKIILKTPLNVNGSTNIHYFYGSILLLCDILAIIVVHTSLQGEYTTRNLYCISLSTEINRFVSKCNVWVIAISRGAISRGWPWTGRSWNTSAANSTGSLPQKGLLVIFSKRPFQTFF